MKFAVTILKLVDRKRIELLPETCKAPVLPLSLTAQIDLLLFLLYAISQGEFWCPRRDSNSQNLVSKTSTYTNSVTRAIQQSSFVDYDKLAVW